MSKYFFVIIIFLNGIIIKAQVHVRDEPRHHNVFENEFVRILDVYLAPGDTTQYHLHNTPSVFTYLTTTTTGSQLQSQLATKSTSRGKTAQYDSLLNPRIHRVWNEDNHWFHVMDIELTGGSPRSNAAILQNSELKLLFNKPLVNGYQVHLKTNTKFRLPASSTGYLMISFGNVPINYQSGKGLQRRLMKSGHYLWIDAGETISVGLNNEAPDGFLLLQLK